MKNTVKIVSVLVLLFISVSMFSQSSTGNNNNGNQRTVEPVLSVTDSLNKKFKPDPMKVVWMGAIIPGYGQLLNRKYWKLPIVYGGFLGCTYFIGWNSLRYSAYRTAYKDIIDTDPNTNSFIDILPPGYTVESYGGISTYTNTLKSNMDQFRYNRDLSIIVSVGYYLLTLVDAYVDAQLYDFDISPDLSMRFSPTLMENRYGVNNTVGLQLSLQLK